MKNKYKVMIMTCIIGLITEIALIHCGVDNDLPITIFTIIVCTINFTCAIFEICSDKAYDWFNRKGLF